MQRLYHFIAQCGELYFPEGKQRGGREGRGGRGGRGGRRGERQVSYELQNLVYLI